jgi:hypothetical protein
MGEVQGRAGAAEINKGDDAHLLIVRHKVTKTSFFKRLWIRG